MVKKIILYGLLSLAILLSSLIIIVNIIGYKTYAVSSDSMAPKIYKNALVVVRPLNDFEKQDLQEEDIIAFYVNGKPVMHKIIYIDEEKIITKGENNNKQDDPIKYQDVIGIVVFSIPVVGLLFRSIYPWIIVSLLIVLYIFVIMLKKELKKGKGD